MAGVTMIGCVPVLGLVLELQQRGFPTLMCARTQAMFTSSHAVFLQACERPFSVERSRRLDIKHFHEVLHRRR
jgi:hypothetical protein